MKTILLLTAILIGAFSARAQNEKSYFVSNFSPADTIRIGDTVMVGPPATGMEYTAIKKNSIENIKKAKKTARLANLAGNIAGAIGIGSGTLGGAQTAVKAVQIAGAAGTVEDILGGAEGLSNASMAKRLIITKIYQSGKGLDAVTCAEAVDGKGSKFTIELDNAVLLKEIILKPTLSQENE